MGTYTNNVSLLGVGVLVLCLVSILKLTSVPQPENQVPVVDKYTGPSATGGKTTKHQQQSQISAVMSTVVRNKWSYSGPAVLWMHVSLISDVSRLGGIMVETGVNEGGTAMVAAACKPSWRELHLYDTFTGIPKPGAKDEKDVYRVYKGIQQGKHGGAIKDGHNNKLLAYLKTRFEDLGMSPGANNIHFHPGLFQDTLHVTDDVAYAHLDGDWYDSTMTSLTRIVPRVVKGGYVVVDDYFTWSGCRKAVDDYFGVSKDRIVTSGGGGLVVKKIGRTWRLTKRQRLVIQAM